MDGGEDVLPTARLWQAGPGAGDGVEDPVGPGERAVRPPAQSSEIARERKEVDLKGEEIRRRLETMIRGKYGSTSNKLKEFGLMPRRPSRRKPDPEGQPAPAPAPSATTQDAT